MLTPTSLVTKFCYFAMNNFVTKSTYSMTTLHCIAPIFSSLKIFIETKLGLSQKVVLVTNILVTDYLFIFHFIVTKFKSSRSTLMVTTLLLSLKLLFEM